MGGYKYLGLTLDGTLSVHPHSRKMKEVLIMKAGALGGVVLNLSAGYRGDLWSLLIRPLFGPPAPLCMVGDGGTNISAVEGLCRKSFKRIVGIAVNVKSDLVEKLAGYDIMERGQKMWEEAEEKWYHRKMRLCYQKKISVGEKREDWLKYIPGEAIKLINMYARMCPKCDGGEMVHKHLGVHGLDVPDVAEIIQMINNEVSGVRKWCGLQKIKWERMKNLNIWGGYCDQIIKKILWAVYGRIGGE